VFRLIHNWKDILKGAWSVRFIVLAFACSMGEVLMPVYKDAMSPGWFAAASALFGTLALVSRVLAQKGLEE